MELHLPPMFIVLIAAVVAPLVGEFTSKFGLSVVVLELLLGVLIGPHALGWATPTHAVPYLAQFGMGFLFFLAGTEIDLLAIREQLRSALVGWLLGFGIALLAALGMQALGLIQAWQVVAIAIATTALGVLVPIIRDHGLLQKPIGQHILAAGALGELGPIIVMSVLLSRRHTAPVQTAFTVLFLVLMVIIGWAAVQGSCTLGLFSATTLSLVVALTEIAISHRLMTPAETAPLIAAGMVTVILFPALGLRLARAPNAD